MIITFIRHAEVEVKYVGKYNGHIDIALSPHGKEQAQNLAKEFKNERFDKIYCSDLKRARETLDAFNYSQEIIYTEKLREKSWGIHEGKSFEEIEKSGIKYIDFEQWMDALDGESPKLFTQKLKKYFYDEILSQECENILVVTHGGVIRTLMSIINKTTLEETFETKLPYASSIKFYRENMMFFSY
ncbi:MAG: histidine phosphatase family protein [Epsilonproteobacteria bacterium]|nr:MAG: histidine phosphatase family protein [Campylobacterota bacterium]